MYGSSHFKQFLLSLFDVSNTFFSQHWNENVSNSI